MSFSNIGVLFSYQLFSIVILGILLLIARLSFVNEKRKKAEDKYRTIQDRIANIQTKESELNTFERNLVHKKMECDKRVSELSEIRDALVAQNKDLSDRVEKLSSSFFQNENFMSNLKAIPYMAGIIADYETYDLEVLAKQLDWGWAIRRTEKVASIREIRKHAMEEIAKNKESQYQLAYLLKMFPQLEDFIETEYSEVPNHISLNDLPEQDSIRSWLSKEEYDSLSESERNQLALDRYIASHQKSKWQIGRDYEQYVQYLYEQRGFRVIPYGQEKKFEDLGRDLIVHCPDKDLIVQCKFWSQKKLIHENHINQIFGTTIAYCIENGLPRDYVQGVLITNTTLSETARKFADYLGIKVRENLPLKEYPRIKCNINTDQFGNKTKIYHLPFDQQYDATIIDKPGEFMALTVAEAEQAGFRRAHRHIR